MGRWQPDARGRLTSAALELYAERGYEQTTVADIAARAGVTERTFFRHFADKREVLFDGSADLQRAVVAAIAAAPDAASPLEAVGAAMEAGAGVLQGRRDHARRRAVAIATTTGLQERELLKLATLSSAAADALRARGVQGPVAALAADSGVTVFRIGFEAWIADDGPDDFPACVRAALRQLTALTASP